MKEPFRDDQRIREVPVGVLNRRTSAVLRMVDRGERVIVSRHGRPLAVIIPIDRALELFVGGEQFIQSRLAPGVDEGPGLGTFSGFGQDGRIRG
jgi:prevent-host-death family protein